MTRLQRTRNHEHEENSAETRISIIPTPINNNKTARAIGPSFRLSSPTIPKGRQAASRAEP